MPLWKHLGWIWSALSIRGFFPVIAALLFLGAMFWAKGRDPFHRVWFTVRAPGVAKAECVAVLPKTAPHPLPVLIYLHGSGGELLTDGNELRQMAEMGLAAIAMEYDQASEAASDAQLAALLAWLGRQRWADTNRMAWVGFSLGAQRMLGFAWRHSEARPNLLVRMSGGWVDDLDPHPQSRAPIPPHPALSPRARASASPETNTLTAGSDARGGPKLFPLPLGEGQGEGNAGGQAQNYASEARASPPGIGMRTSPRMSVLLLHGGSDEVFPLAQEERVKAFLQSNAIPAQLRVFAGQDHGLWGSRLVIDRALGEYCLTFLEGPEALGRYQSILSWQEQARPLWMFWIPAALWVVLCWWARRAGSFTALLAAFRRSGMGLLSPALSSKGGEGEAPQSSSLVPEPQAGPAVPLARWEIGLRWVAVVLAVAAAGQTALHLVPPRLAVSEGTLSIARKHIVLPKQKADFEVLAAKPYWRGKHLGTLLEHVELANYNRELINWKLDERFYREFVLSPEIDPASDGALDWRRPLWENFYPRIRKEDSPEAAAEIVARFLRERVTIAPGDHFPEVIAEAWRCQITTPRGFEALYVAALRSVGVPARLGSGHRAEFWTGAAWEPAPRPVVEQAWL